MALFLLFKIKNPYSQGKETLCSYFFLAYLWDAVLGFYYFLC
jgi:hypothetical protein